MARWWHGRRKRRWLALGGDGSQPDRRGEARPRRPPHRWQAPRRAGGSQASAPASSLDLRMHIRQTRAMTENDKLRRYLIVTDHALDDQQLAATVQPSLAAEVASSTYSCWPPPPAPRIASCGAP